jgi:hypothetical protein
MDALRRSTLQLVAAVCFLITLATSAFAFTLSDVDRSGGCCCNIPENYCAWDLCGGQQDCDPGEDCCFIPCCWE